MTGPQQRQPDVRLEPVAMEHAEAVQRLASDPAIGATSNLPSPYPPDGAVTFIRDAVAKRQAGTDYAFAILAEGRVVGACGLSQVNRETGTAELGYWVGREFWGRGYATAGAKQLLAFGFLELDLKRIVASSVARNHASRRILEKLGFRATGLGRSSHPKWAPSERFALFELTRHEWEAR